MFFYELAIRHAIRKPLVQIISKGDRIPFDVAGLRTIHFDHRDLDSVDTARREIAAQIKEIENAKEPIETPISVSINLQLLRQSERPEERSLADLVSAVADVRSSVSKIEEKVAGNGGDEPFAEIRSTLKRIVKKFDEADGPIIPANRRLKRVHPGAIYEMIMESNASKNPAISFLFASGILREFTPWISDLLVEVGRLLNSKQYPKARQLFSEIRNFSRLSVRRRGLLEETFETGERYEVLLDAAFHALEEVISKAGSSSGRKTA